MYIIEFKAEKMRFKSCLKIMSNFKIYYAKQIDNPILCYNIRKMCKRSCEKLTRIIKLQTVI